MTDSLIVHIVDDDESVRQSLAFLLSTAGMMVGVSSRRDDQTEMPFVVTLLRVDFR